MQKLLLATAVAISTSSASFAAIAANESNSGAFVHLGAGQTRYHTEVKQLDREKARSYDLLGGYRWGLGKSFALGVEGGVTQLGSIDRVDHASAPNMKYSQGTAAWLAGANAKWNISRNFSLNGRVGAARVHTHFAAQSIGSNAFRSRATVSADVAYLGLGVGYALTDHLDLTLQATRYDMGSSSMKDRINEGSVATYNAGVEYRF